MLNISKLYSVHIMIQVLYFMIVHCTLIKLDYQRKLFYDWYFMYILYFCGLNYIQYLSLFVVSQSHLK